ncbi:MAG: cation diffusion facilitator family transporter [Solirubrobacteraceae bacterium]
MQHHHAHEPHAHPRGAHQHDYGGADASSLRTALALIGAFMAVEIAAGLYAASLALLSDAAHMLTDAAALAMALLAARLAQRPASGSMTYGLARAEILSAAANGMTMLVLCALIAYGAVLHLISPPAVDGGVVLAVALVGIAINLLAARLLRGGERTRSLNVEGSYRHILTDLFGFIATAIAAAVILTTGFRRADAIASLLIAAVMLGAGIGLVRAATRVVMEAAPAGLDPQQIGHTLAEQRGVVEVHDLHVWEVTSGFPALSAHVVVDADRDCHELRRGLSRLLEDRFEIHHSTLQVEHARAPQPPMQIEVAAREKQRAPE